MTDTSLATTKQALAAIKARLAGFTALPCFYQNDNNQLSDTPASFVYVLFETHNQNHAAYGGGRGQNRWRTLGSLEMFVFVPTGQGTDDALDYAEELAVLFRGQRFGGVSCEAVQIDPNAMKAQAVRDLAGNYYAVSAIADLYFDQVG